MSLSAKAVSRPIATAMIYLIVITLGIIGFRMLPVDLLPPIEYPQLTIAVNYDNVGPEEMERIITDQIENAIAGVPNIDRVNSNSSEGNSRVTLHFAQGTNLDEATNDVRAALDRVRRSLPPEVDPPRIWRFDPNDAPIVVIGAISDREMSELTRILEREIGKRFEQIPGIGSIDVWGGVYREIHVDLIRERLTSSNITANDVVNAIGRENVNLPGGNIKEGLNDLYVRTLGEFREVEDVQNTIITTVDGVPIRVGDVAQVTFGYQEINRYVEIDNRPTIRMGLRKQSGANTVAVARQVHEEVRRVNLERSDLELRVITDQSDYINQSIDNVRNAAIWGGILAIIVLFSFLRNGSATMIIGITIPISIIATFGLLYFGGLTLNQMSFGGLALGVGLIVDNAIVVLENIVRQRQNGKGKKKSALIGTKQVAGAIVASTLTTSVIFLPVVFMTTVTGMMFQELALVVVFSLLCSLLVALTLVPMLSSKYLKVEPDHPDISKRPRWQQFMARFENAYAHGVGTALRFKGTIVTVTAVLVALAFYKLPDIPFELAPQTEADEIRISMNMDGGTNIAIIYEYMQELNAIVDSIVPMTDVRYITREARNGNARIDLTLVDYADRTQSANALADEIRERLAGTIPGAEIRVNARTGLWVLRRVFSSGGGDDTESVAIQLRGFNLETAEELALMIRDRIEDIEGVADVWARVREGRPEQNIRFDRERMSRLGISAQDLGAAIQSNVGGRRAGVFRMDGEEIPITVRLRPEDRVSIHDIDNINVRTAQGDIVPISTVAEQVPERGPTNINRINGQRVTFITANLESGVPLGTAVDRIRSDLAEIPLPDGFSIYFGGEYEEQQRAQRDFNLAIIMALLLIYMVMAAQFERFLDPLIVMFSVPVAIVGVVPTMILTNTTMNLQSLMGVMMLLGIVVNNAIVLVDYINLMRREQKLSIKEAVVEAGRLRLRPILLTTFTTILALIPLSIGIGAGGELQASLARVVIGGLTASTLITLFLIPVVYVSANQAIERVRAYLVSFRPSAEKAAVPQSQAG
ncbi:hydrophobic/amphiphilic exporter-1, HAE1 family [Cyclonatronum proteinivorum]|uniref:Hydrophobic/amphiphilic exporter-1, HAE1 family n=1 Tax=Cyclonatronum proteinivorum TaxID=1457365 RepID=A0A345UP22_9BACT|nr:efflux RND transporter permease subunit [Cyclonatronum proteinivorum]AXJ02224.1 hydrophobic/amphiphilic exporter-1, HAE1 family [Cyclonatronum proteinivorum]